MRPHTHIRIVCIFGYRADVGNHVVRSAVCFVFPVLVFKHPVVMADAVIPALWSRVAEFLDADGVKNLSQANFFNIHVGCLFELFMTL